jgi:hypothetical protein
LPKSQIVTKIPNLLNLGFWQQFRILATVWDFGNSLDFGNDLGFQQQFGILAKVWNFGNSLEFWQQFEILAIVWDFGNSLGFWQQFGILTIVWDLEFWQLIYAERGLGFGI